MTVPATPLVVTRPVALTVPSLHFVDGLPEKAMASEAVTIRSGSDVGIGVGRRDRDLHLLALNVDRRDTDIAEDAEKALNLAPENAEAQMLVGVLHLRAGNLAAAEAAFRRQIKLGDAGNGSTDAGLARYRGHTMLGDVLAAREDHDEAMAAYAEAQREVKALLERDAEHAGLRRDLSVTYDRIGDILYINKCEPYLGQESEMLEDEIVVRLNPKTNAVENLEILFFSKRMEQSSDWSIPVLADLRLAA